MRTKRRNKLAAKLGHFPPPLRKVPAVTKQYQCVAVAKAVGGNMNKGIIIAPWPMRTGWRYR